MLKITNSAILRDAAAIALIMNGILTGRVFAQTPDGNTDPRTLDAITVTGSRISVPGIETSSPVANVERNEFLATQPVAVESFLKEFPALTPSVGPGDNYEPGGGATINMRGLGDNRTLVLVNGRRPVPFNLQSVVDTNTIPISLLQSVEMLTGGASVVYGADAVAGVTNFILRQDFEGVEFNMNFGKSTTYGDADRQNYEITLGTLSDDGRANAVLSAGFSSTEPAPHAARPWARVFVDARTGQPTGSTTTFPAVVNVVGAGQGNRQVDVANGALVPIYQRYNPFPHYFSNTGLERWQAMGLARYEFTRSAEAYAQVNYTRSRITSQQAPVGVFLQVLDIPLANPYLPTGMRQQICTELKIADANCASGHAGINADGDLIYAPLQIGRRITEMGVRLNDYDTKTFQATAGLRGDIGEHWRYDAYWSHGESEQVQSVTNWGGLSKVRQAVNAISTSTCIDPSGGCVPLNLFGDEGSISREQLNFINLNAFSIQSVEQTNAIFNLNGDLGNFRSPWTEYPIGLSAGIEYRRMVAGIQPDAAYSTPNEILGLESSIFNFKGGLSIIEAYLESIIPVLSGRRGAEKLSLEVGYRHSEFSNTSGFDDHYGSWKYGLVWSPTTQLKFRAMHQRATRAPNVGELFAPGRTTVDNLNNDPCEGGAINLTDSGIPGTLSWLCAQTGVPTADIGNLPGPSIGQVNVFIGGNSQLGPEKADTTTFGLVWTPKDWLSVTLDWWDIKINDAITTTTVQDMIGGCYDPVLNQGFIFNDFCAQIGRNPLTGTLNGAGSRGIARPLSNSGFLQKTGVDLGVRLAHGLPWNLGRMQYALDVSKVSRDDFQATPTSIMRDCLGYYSSCTPSHDLRSHLRAIWTMGDISATLAWRYWSDLDLEPLENAAGGPFLYDHIRAYSYFDLGLSYQTSWNAQFNFSVNNIFDKKPPFIGIGVGKSLEANGSTYPQWYDVLGRFVTLGVSFRF